LHRNFIYEENVRSFLMLLDPRLTSGPVISNELGSIGDVFPTLAHLAVGETPTSSGRSLLERPFTERVVFFHKRTEPWRWGLRDGNWKFIATQNDDSEVELYDLADDPMEQSNLAELHPEMVADYQTRVATWFFHSERDFARRRDGLGADVPTLVLGRKQDGRFAPSSLFGPYDKILARVEADPASTAAVSMRWEGPTGAPHIVELSPLDSRRTATIALTPDPSHALGRWRVALLVEGRERASGSFAVSSHVSDISD
jgi:hypothetical protein